MAQSDFFLLLTPSSETLSPDEAYRVSSYFTNTDRSIVAIKNLPEVIKGALFSRYSRSAKGVRRLFLDEFLTRSDLGIADFSCGTDHLADLGTGEEKAEDFYRRVLSDYGDDSVGELGGAHLSCQEVSQVAARAIENGRVGISYLEKSSRYVPFDDRVNGQYRYYRPRRILESPFGAEYVTLMDSLFDSYAHHLPRMMERVKQRAPIENIEFENALTGDVLRYSEIRDDDMRKSAEFAYRQSVRARAFDMLRCFLPMATLTNVGVWGNGRALEYMLTRLYADPLDEVQLIAQAAHYELTQVVGPFVKRADDEHGKDYQSFLKTMSIRQRDLAHQFLPPSLTAQPKKVTLVAYDVDAVDKIVAAILYPGSNLPKSEIVNCVRDMSDAAKSDILRAYIGERKNRRHKPGRAFEHAAYEFDLLLNIGEYRDLQRHRLVTSERQMFTTQHGYEINEDINAVPDIRADYLERMEETGKLRERLAVEMPFDAQYVVPFGFRVRYNVRLNLREAYHWIELRSAPQGHPDYRNTSQEMFRAIQAVHPVLTETMNFVNLTPDVPLGRLRAEMRRAHRDNSASQVHPPNLGDRQA
ncbi:MAG: FAD-dependent thymidylate synthase [Chloroflexi bacterium]|nr:FAD-dependent thymidylate synthase [Chloroflexota bacterium]